jgi:hypothetical protein
MIVLLLACSGDFTDEEVPLSEAGLPDQLFGLEEDGCETLEGREVAGAVAWYWGEYLIDGDAFQGEERLIYFANDAWRDQGGADCAVVWQTDGTSGSPGACGSCDMGMSVSAVLDTGQSDCPEGLLGDEGWSEDYGLARSDDGTVSWYFAESGSRFAAGYYNDVALSYLSDKTCVWFGG